MNNNTWTISNDIFASLESTTQQTPSRQRTPGVGLAAITRKQKAKRKAKNKMQKASRRKSR